MDKRKTGCFKYILDFLVVFVGVTMAFALNAWFENLTMNNYETVHLVNILGELKKNHSYHQTNFKEDSIWLEKTDRILNLIKENETIKRDSSQVILELISSFRKTNYDTKGYDVITNSVELNLRKDWELKTKIINYYSGHLFVVTTLEEDIYRFYKDHFIELMLEYNDNWEDERAINKSANILQVFYDFKEPLLKHHKEAELETWSLMKAIDDYSSHINVNFVE